jgi:hypothetical protein
MQSSARLKIVHAAPLAVLSPARERPDLPQKDNEPGSVDVLLAANKMVAPKSLAGPLSQNNSHGEVRGCA